MIPLYVLEDRVPVPCPDPVYHAVWMHAAFPDQIVVAKETVAGAEVSTVFLGMPTNLADVRRGGVPLLFETMVFGYDLDGEQRRYATWADAAAGHAAVVAEVKAAMSHRN